MSKRRGLRFKLEDLDEAAQASVREQLRDTVDPGHRFREAVRHADKLNPIEHSRPARSPYTGKGVYRWCAEQGCGCEADLDGGPHFGPCPGVAESILKGAP